jgi:hypothetical protein
VCHPRLAALAAALALLAGCSAGAPLPVLHPLAGTVTNHGQPVRGGALRFFADPALPDLIVSAPVGPDGRFTAATVRGSDHKGERRPGAPAGVYRVMFYPPAADQRIAAPVEVPHTVAVEPRAGEVRIELSGRAP